MELVTKVGKMIHAWSYEDAQEISAYVMALENGGEIATTFVHRAMR